MTTPFSRIPQPMIGMNYEPAPSDDTTNPPPTKYGDTDFANDDFAALWNVDQNAVGRQDLQTIKTLGCNTVKMYNWSVPPPPPNSYWERDHANFLALCQSLGLSVIVPISNYFTATAYGNRTGGGQPGPNPSLQAWITQIVEEVYSTGGPGPAVMWAIGNEYDLCPPGSYGYFEATDVATIASYIVAAEAQLGVAAADVLAFTSPVSTAMPPLPNPSIPDTAPYNTIMGGTAIQALTTAFTAAIGATATAQRFIASVNSYQIGAQLTQYYSAYHTVFPETPFFYGELGYSAYDNGATTQAQNIYSQFSTTLPQSQPGSYFYGSCVFEFSDELWKGSAESSEVMFGIYTFASPNNPQTSNEGNHPPPPVTNASYPVDQFAARPAVQYFQAAITGQPMPD
ncbi:MAG: hypothetical protein WDN03_05245 [Rhizomicrobium sp.]